MDKTVLLLLARWPRLSHPRNFTANKTYWASMVVMRVNLLGEMKPRSASLPYPSDIQTRPSSLRADARGTRNMNTVFSSPLPSSPVHTSLILLEGVYGSICQRNAFAGATQRVVIGCAVPINAGCRMSFVQNTLYSDLCHCPHLRTMASSMSLTPPKLARGKVISVLDGIIGTIDFTKELVPVELAKGVLSSMSSILSIVRVRIALYS